jgi:anti-sigma factor RsiW
MDKLWPGGRVWENALPAIMEKMSIDIVTHEAPAPSRPRRRGTLRAFALVAAVLFFAGLWARGLPAFVAWEVASDHQRCFGRRHLPARVWSTDPAEVQEWLESRGTPTPPLPREAGQGALVGARYCPLSDRVAAHVYYGGDGAGLVSVFVLSGPARIGDGWSGTTRGLHVRLLHAAGRTLAVVGESEADVAATAGAFLVTIAEGCPTRRGTTLLAG